MLDLLDVISDIGTQSAQDALVVSFTQSPNPEVQARAIARLSKVTINNERVIEYLVHALSHSSIEVRKSAIRALVVTEGSQPRAELLYTLADRSQSVRTYAAHELKQAGWTPTSPEESAVLLAASCEWDKLISLGDLGKRHLIGALHVDRHDVREAAACALDSQKWRPENPSDEAIYLIVHKQFEEAARIGKEAVEPLSTVLFSEISYNARDGSKSVDHLYKQRGEILNALESTGSPEALAPLIQYCRLGMDGDYIWLHHKATGRLESLLCKVAEEAPDEILREIVSLKPVSVCSDVSDYEPPEPRLDDFQGVKALAAKELTRRNTCNDEG